MDANVRLEHAVLAVDGEHGVRAMVEIIAPALIPSRSAICAGSLAGVRARRLVSSR